MRKSGQRYMPMEMCLDSNLDHLSGCLIDKQQFSIHWIHEYLSSPKPGKNMQTFGTLPHYFIDYPILCYDGPFPDGREITLVNLADMDSARNTLTLNSLKFICFVGHRSKDTDCSSICFLAKDLSTKGTNKWNESHSIVHCVLNCEKMFQKKIERNMGHFSVDTEDLGRKARQKVFQKQLVSIIVIESVHNFAELRHGSRKIQQCFVIQTKKEIKVFTHYQEDQGIWKNVTDESLM